MVARLNGLLDEQGMVRCQDIDIGQRRADRPAAPVEFHHDIDLVADGVADGLHQTSHLFHLGKRCVVVGVGNDQHLDCVVTHLDGFDDALDVGLDVVCRAFLPLDAAAEIVAVDPDLVAAPAAEQPPDRDAEILAADVPQRLFDGAECRKADDAEGPEAVALDLGDQVLDAGWVLADDHRRDVLDRADDGPGLPFQRRLAPAVEAGLIGEHLYEHPVSLDGIDDMGFDAGDFQFSDSLIFMGGYPGLASLQQAGQPGGQTGDHGQQNDCADFGDKKRQHRPKDR